MIEFETWIEEILGYCSLVKDIELLQRAWMKGDRSETSVTNFDEFYVQIFDDLDADWIESNLLPIWPLGADARLALSGFLEAIRVVDERQESYLGFKDAAELLRSAEWNALIAAGDKVKAALGH